MPYPSEHSARIIDPGKFEKESFRRKNIEKGIDIIIGKLKGQSSMTTQAYRFDAKIFTTTEAKKWLKDHKIDYISFEEATNKEMKEYRPCLYEVKSLDEKGVVRFYANVFNTLDTDRDISLPGSFQKTLVENGNRLRHFKFHDHRLMPGVVMEAKEDQIGLLITSQLMLNTMIGKETYEEYKALAAAGKQMEHSVGVNAVKYEITDPGDWDKQVRTISEWKLWEVSTLSAWGANDKALTVSIKDLDGASKDEIIKEIIFLKGLLNIQSYSELKLEQIEKQINFLDKLKAGLQPEPDKATTDSTTLKEFKAMLNL